MASGYSAGGPDFYAGIEGRSVENTGAVSNNQPTAPYRKQIPGIFVVPASQIVNRATPNLIGNRTLADFEKQQLQYNNLGRNNLYLRSVKPRTNYQHSSSISPLSPIGFSSNLSPDVMGNFSSPSACISQRYHGLPLLQQPRPEQLNPVETPVIQQQDSEKKMMNQLHELEKQLFQDENDGEGDAVSVITNTNSEWSEAIQKLISSGSPINLVAPSPTSSSSSTSSVASPALACSKKTIIEAASAISEGKSGVVNEILTRLVQVGNAKGNSEQRLMGCMLLALKSRVNSVENPPPVAELFSEEHATATHLLYDLSPCFKLGFLAANLAIVDATFEQPSCNKLHIIDFDIGQGGQYKNLLHALSELGSKKPTLVKITAIADDGGDDRLKIVGDQLSQIAERVGVYMKFNVVTGLKLSDLTRESLGCEADESLAVNFAFKLYRMPDESVCVENPRDELLRRVKGFAPRVVTLVEQEMNTNTAPFASRVAEASAYYGALFESIQSTVSRENSQRMTVEEGLCRKIANSVSCEGRDRVERCEVLGKWRARMSMAGFELKPLSQSVAESMRGRLNGGNRINPGFTVKEENGAVCFGWMNRTLIAASAWR
ncbi:Scarecrow-like protein 8 [Hibiscus syriacus]|uniref:Scarecrow-like protein 8 n=1 Tax=Hibiscus syriacus TaxID=106335 RepID=A0A6A3A4L5_HIBSY|nr:scarecrow-like protein 8 [Hibiscus syriacus]XP_039007284.1 scarecrow-like protein 8 [Hibiscus syriacus]KAE8698182.1 Scarecrow-like protein 8 [Hibiscus syriacus]